MTAIQPGAPTVDRDASGAPAAPAAETDAHDAEIVEELLIEEISIDGLCGVY